MRVVIEVDGVKCSVESNDVTLTDLVQLVDQAIKGVGFYPPKDSMLDYVQDSD